MSSKDCKGDKVSKIELPVPFTLYSEAVSCEIEHRRLYKNVFAVNYKVMTPDKTILPLFLQPFREDYGFRVAIKVEEDEKYFDTSTFKLLRALGNSFEDDGRVLHATLWGIKDVNGPGEHLYPHLQLMTTDTSHDFIIERSYEYLGRGE